MTQQHTNPCPKCGSTLIHTVCPSWQERFYEDFVDEIGKYVVSMAERMKSFIAKEIEDAEQRGYNKKEKELVDSMHPAQRRFYEGIPPTNHKDTPV